MVLFVLLSSLSAGIVRESMAGLTNSCNCFAYRIEQAEKGGYVLHITNATVILVCISENGYIGVDLTLCPAIFPNLPYTEIFVSYKIKDEPIVRMQSGPKGDLWICKDGPFHP